RTSSGGNIYTSLFIPNNTPYWEGHLQLFQFTASGDILDSTGACALLNPSPPGTCQTGQINPSATPFWDAANQVPAPALRKLYTSMPSGSVSVRTTFDNAILSGPLAALGDPSTTADDLTLANKPSYALSNATTPLMLGQEI